MELGMTGLFIDRDPAYAPSKAIAAIGFLVEATGADLYSVMKMLYLADRDHVSRFGRSVTGDSYTAMEKGPVPEFSYNLCKFVDGRREHFDPLPEAKSLIGMKGYEFVLHRSPDLKALSRSDISSLESAAAIYRAGGWKAVADEAHDRAWSAAWDEAKSRQQRAISMSWAAIIASFANGPELLEFLADPHPGEAALADGG